MPPGKSHRVEPPEGSEFADRKLAEGQEITEAMARWIVNDAVSRAGGFAAFARKAGVSGEYVAQALAGEKSLSPKVLKAAGLSKEVVTSTVYRATRELWFRVPVPKSR